MPRTYVVLITALLCSIPLLYGISTGFLIGLGAVSVASMVFHKVRFNKTLLIPVFLYGLMVCSLLWTDSTENTLRGLERQLALVLVPLAFIGMPALTETHRNKILNGFALGMAVLALFFMTLAGVDYFQNKTSGRFFYHELVKPLDLNAIYLSVIVALCIVYLLFRKGKTKMTFVALAILGAFLVLLSSKAVIISLILLIGMGVSKRLQAKKVALLGAFIVLSMVLIGTTENPVKERFNIELAESNIPEVLEKEKFTRVYYWTGSTIRVFQARIFSEMLKEDGIFWTGYGLNSSQEKITKKHLDYNLYKGFHNYNFHNQYLQAFAELGIFGLLFLFLLLGVILRQYLLGKDILFLSLFFIMFVIFISESYIWRQRGLYHFLILYCLLFKTAPSGKKPDRTITNAH